MQRSSGDLMSSLAKLDQVSSLIGAGTAANADQLGETCSR